MDPKLDDELENEVENENGPDESALSSNENGEGEQTASPAEKEQTSLDAMSEALVNAQTESEEGHEEKTEDEEGDSEKVADEDGEKDGGSDNDEPKSKAPTDEELLKPLPEGTPEKTAERFEKLTEGFKSLKEDYELLETEAIDNKKYREDFDALIQHSSATPEEFNELINYSHMVKNGDLEGALALLDGQRQQLANAMGKSLPGVDLFSAHPDLQEKIENFEMSEEDAAEIVRARNLQQQQQNNQAELKRQQENDAIQQKADHDFNARVNTANNAVMSLVEDWQKNDINFKAKQAVIVAKVEEIGKDYPPEQWAEQLNLNYQTIKVDGRSSSRSVNQHRPLRTGGGGSGGTKAPASSLDAMSQALDSL